MTRCQRCSKETRVTTMSRFNTQILCMECLEKEKKHPKYKEAAAAELRAVQAGNYNFSGIGKPADL
jgi:recombinational DNA repair protein (RecF pathway)